MIQEYKKSSHVQLSENFNSDEFDCHCKRDSCQITYVDSDLIKYLQDKRSLLNKSFIVNSGFRCVSHNKDVGGKPGSIHLQGKAADIRFKTGNIVDCVKIFKDSDGLGVYAKQKFIHVDVRGYHARWKG